MARYAPDGAAEHDVVMPAFKYNMTDIQAAIGLHQLARPSELHGRRSAIWAQYDAGFADLPLRLPTPVDAGGVHARHLYTVVVDEATPGISRDTLRARLRDRGVSTSIHVRALHLHPHYQERFGLRRGMFPAAEAASDTTLSLRLAGATPAATVDRVIEAAHEVLR